MNVLKITVGHHLSNLFVDNVAFNVAKLLEESEEGQAANVNRKWAVGGRLNNPPRLGIRVMSSASSLGDAPPGSLGKAPRLASGRTPRRPCVQGFRWGGGAWAVPSPSRGMVPGAGNLSGHPAATGPDAPLA